MKTNKNNRNSFGFSLLEVLVTIFIAGLILLIYGASSNILFLSRSAKDQEIALRVANNKIEELRAVGYDALPASGGFSDSQLNLLQGSFATMTITDFNADTKQIIVTVQWQEPGSSVLRTISLPTLITKVGGL